MSRSGTKSRNRPDPDHIRFVRNGNGTVSAAPSGKRNGDFSVKKGIIIIIILILILLIGGIIVYPMTDQKENLSVYGDGNPYVGVLVVNGEIGSSADDNNTYQHSWTLEQIREMKRDDLNQGILLYVNSPGGSVFETDELYTELSRYQKKTNRPLYAYFDEQAASGGYYIAAGADKIIANKLCTTGSIGVYMGPVIDSSRLLTKLGVSVKFIKSGRNKAMGNPFSPLTAEQQEIYQSQVDEYYERFAGIVSEGRNLSIDTVYEIGDGRPYTASQALENGLVDIIGSYNKAKKIMKEECKTGQFVLVQYQPEPSVYDYFFGLCETFRNYVNNQGKSETQKTLEYLSENGGRTFYYESFD